MSEGKRSDTLRIRLAPDVLERLEQVAERHGFPVASYAAFAIGRHLVDQENQLSAMRMGVIEASRRSVDTVLEQVDIGGMLQSLEAAQVALSHAKPEADPPASAGA